MRGTKLERKRSFAKMVKASSVPIGYLSAVVELMWGAFERGMEQHENSCPLCGNGHDIDLICHHCGHGEEKYE